MTNNDELALNLKAAAERATPGKWEMEGENIWYFDDGHTKHLMYIYQGDDVSEDQDSANTRYVATANPANILSLLAERDSDKSLINKIKSTCCAVDMKDGSLIPSSLDAWGRPVPQYLPYDFSGNPGASATQYCNGWNDAGGYWLNYVSELRQRIAELEARTVSVKLPKLKMLKDYLAEVAEEERKQIIIGVKLEFHRLFKEASDAAGIKLEVGE